MRRGRQPGGLDAGPEAKEGGGRAVPDEAAARVLSTSRPGVDEAVPELHAAGLDADDRGRAVGHGDQTGADRLVEPGVGPGRERKLVVGKDLDNRVVDDDGQVERDRVGADLGPKLKIANLGRVVDCRGRRGGTRTSAEDRNTTETRAARHAQVGMSDDFSRTTVSSSLARL